MKQCTYWETSSFSADQDFSEFYGNWGSLQPVTCSYPEPDQSSPCLPSKFMKIHINIIFLCKRRDLHAVSLPRCFPTNALYAPLLSSIRATCPAYSWFYHQNYISWVQIVKLVGKKNSDYVSLNNVIILAFEIGFECAYCTVWNKCFYQVYKFCVSNG